MGKIIYDKIWKECEGISVVECIEEKNEREDSVLSVPKWRK